MRNVETDYENLSFPFYAERMCVVSVLIASTLWAIEKEELDWSPQNTCVSSHVLLPHTMGDRMNLCDHLSMSRILVYFFLIVSPSISFKLVLWISFSRNLKKVGCHIDQNKQYFNQVGKPSHWVV